MLTRLARLTAPLVDFLQDSSLQNLDALAEGKLAQLDRENSREISS